MKTHRRKYFIVIASVVAGAALVFFLLFRVTDGFGGSPMFWFATYDHIQYDGVAYYMAEDQSSPFSKGYSNEPVSVSLVNKSLKVDYDHPYDAYGYPEDPDHVYLFFDGAVWTKDLSLAAQHYNLSPSTSNSK